MIETLHLGDLAQQGARNIPEEFNPSFERPSVEEPPPKPVIDVEKKTREIFEKAYEQGEKAGYEMGMKRVEPLATRLNQAIAKLSSFQKELLERAEVLATDLALTLTEALVQTRCDEKRDTILHMARKALEIFETREQVVLRVRRDDAVHIRDCGDLTNITVVADDGLKEPGFVIETNFGDIDGRLSTQIEELRRFLLHG
jgi:flagellar assembly protein FliH